MIFYDTEQLGSQALDCFDCTTSVQKYALGYANALLRSVRTCRKMLYVFFCPNRLASVTDNHTQGCDRLHRRVHTRVRGGRFQSLALQALTRACCEMPFTKSSFAGIDSRILRFAVYKILSGDGGLIYEGLTLFHAFSPFQHGTRRWNPQDFVRQLCRQVARPCSKELLNA